MDQNFHLIEKYFQGKLDRDELQLFNQKLQQDPSFEEEFRDMKLIRDAVKESSRVRALDILQNTEANLTNQETTKINVSMKRLVSIAASLLIVATVSYFAFSGGTGALTGEEVYSAYYEPYTNIVSGQERGTTIELTTLTARAYNAYDIGDYSTSADLFANLLASEKSAANYLYSGIANLEAGNLDMAKNNLNTVMNNFTELKEQAQWYLAMTLFKEGSENEAVTNLAVIASSEANSVISKNASDILMKMKIILDDGDNGSVGQVERKPETGGLPDGSLIERRQYQVGFVTSLKSSRSYRFFNDFPIDGLQDGDLVEFVLINRKNQKPVAVLLDKF